MDRRGYPIYLFIRPCLGGRALGFYQAQPCRRVYAARIFKSEYHSRSMIKLNLSRLDLTEGRQGRCRQHAQYQSFVLLARQFLKGRYVV